MHAYIHIIILCSGVCKLFGLFTLNNHFGKSFANKAHLYIYAVRIQTQKFVSTFSKTCTNKV